MLSAIFKSASRRLFSNQKISLFSSVLHRKLTYSTNDSGLLIKDSSFPYRWLRDSCQCPACVHPSTSQKLHRTSDIFFDTTPSPGGIRTTEEGLFIEWTTGHKSFYPSQFLERHSSPSTLSAAHKDLPRIPWDVASLSKSPNLFVQYTSLEKPSALSAAITQLSQFGLLFVTGVPNTETSNDTCELRTLAQYFSEIRNTFYGELWDVKNLRNSKNIAYTNLDLGLHMDLLYFEHPPRFQLLHCLRNRVIGGTSIFVDALHAATTLQTSNPEAFDVLASTPVTFQYINDGHHLHQSHRTIDVAAPMAAASTPHERQINHINYSPPFQAPLPLSTTPPAFYPALAEFASLLNNAELTYQYTLKEGDTVLFDNRRVLHARTAFTDKEFDNGINEGEPNRWLKGCYVEADALLDRGRMLRAEVHESF